MSDERRAEIERTECAICGKPGYWGHRFDDDHPVHPYKPVPRRYIAVNAPDSVLAALLADGPEAAVAAIEALLTSDRAVLLATVAQRQVDGYYDKEAVRAALVAACRSLLSKPPKEDGDA